VVEDAGFLGAGSEEVAMLSGDLTHVVVGLFVGQAIVAHLYDSVAPRLLLHEVSAHGCKDVEQDARRVGKDVVRHVGWDVIAAAPAQAYWLVAGHVEIYLTFYHVPYLFMRVAVLPGGDASLKPEFDQHQVVAVAEHAALGTVGCDHGRFLGGIGEQFHVTNSFFRPVV